MDFESGSRVALAGLESERGRRLNGLSGTIDAWDVPSSRWIVKLSARANRRPSHAFVKVRPENLILLRAHRTSVEAPTSHQACEMLSAISATDIAGGTCTFGGDDRALPADLVLLHMFPLLSRYIMRTGGAAGMRLGPGELEAASEVCREWRGVCLALRALTPACARDVAVKLRLERAGRGELEGEESSADGEQWIWPRGDRSRPPLSVHCHNVLSARPTEFLTLHDAPDRPLNLSYFPVGGAAQGSVLITVFRKLRLCPWSLTVKTDDYTFSSSTGRVSQTYWNGERTLTLEEVPYATARDAVGHGPVAGLPHRGQAQLDLRGTGLAVRIDTFRPVGCAAFGAAGVPLSSAGSDARRLNAVQQRLALYGGGFAGRLTPIADRTMDERAVGGNYDDEGRNGGWVLPLTRVETNDDDGEEDGWLADTQIRECPIASMDSADTAIAALAMGAEPMHLGRLQ